MGIRRDSLPPHVLKLMDEQKPAPKAHRTPAGTMNKTEAAFASALECRRVCGEVKRFIFEGITFKLGVRCRYTPDFAVFPAEGALILYDVKGRKGDRYYAKDDALVKIKTAATIYPGFIWAITWQGKDGKWREERFKGL